MKLFPLLILVLTALPVVSYGAEVVKADLPRKDDILEVRSTAAALRDNTPDPGFGGKAPQIGWVKKGESVRVLDSRQYLTIFGMEIWLEVQKVDEPASHGWVLDGMSKDILKGNSNLEITRAAPRTEEAKAPADPRDAAAEEAARKADALVEDAD